MGHPIGCVPSCPAYIVPPVPFLSRFCPILSFCVPLLSGSKFVSRIVERHKAVVNEPVLSVPMSDFIAPNEP